MTGRVKKLEIRLTEAEAVFVAARAEAGGVSRSELARRGLGLKPGVESSGQAPSAPLRDAPARVSSGVERRQTKAEVAGSNPVRGSGVVPRPLPDAAWISRRSDGEVSYLKAADALSAGQVEWSGGKIVVNGKEF